MNAGQTLQLLDFRVLPRHTGTWEGDWLFLDAKGQETLRYRAVLTQRIEDNRWLQTNQNYLPDGRTATQNFVGQAIGPGRVRVESTEPPFSNYQMVAEEHGDLLLFEIKDQATGQLLALETINLLDDARRRVRSTQSFAEDGQLRGFLLIQETRIK